MNVIQEKYGLRASTTLRQVTILVNTSTNSNENTLRAPSKQEKNAYLYGVVIFDKENRDPCPNRIFKTLEEAQLYLWDSYTSWEGYNSSLSVKWEEFKKTNAISRFDETFGFIMIFTPARLEWEYERGYVIIDEKF